MMPQNTSGDFDGLPATNKNNKAVKARPSRVACAYLMARRGGEQTRSVELSTR